VSNHRILGEGNAKPLLEAPVGKKVGLTSQNCLRIQRALRNLASPHTDLDRSRRWLPKRRLVGWSSPLQW